MQFRDNRILPSTPWTEFGGPESNQPSFTVTQNCTIDETGSYLNFGVNITHINKHLETFLETGKIACYLHIECPETRYRSTERIPYNELYSFNTQRNIELFYYSIESIVLFIPTEDIAFLNSTGSPSGMLCTQEYEAGSYAGYSTAMTTELTKPFEALTAQSIPINLMPKEDIDCMSVEFDTDDIIVNLLPKQFEEAMMLQKRSDIARNVQAIYLQPAIMTIIQAILNGDGSEQNYRWYMMFEQKLKDSGYPKSFDEMDPKDTDVCEIANILLRTSDGGSFVQTDAIDCLNNIVNDTSDEADEQDDGEEV